MARYYELEAYTHQQVRAVLFNGVVLEGTLHAVVGDTIIIGKTLIRPGKAVEVYLLDDEGVSRIWPPPAIEEPTEALPEKPVFNEALYDLAVGLIGKLVRVKVGQVELVGTLEAVSSRVDPFGPKLHISIGEEVPVALVALNTVDQLELLEGSKAESMTLDILEQEIQALHDSKPGHPFEGRAGAAKTLPEIAAEILQVSEGHTEPVLTTIDRACAHYGLSMVAKQALQALISRLQRQESDE